MSGETNHSRNAIGFITSLVLHALLIGMIIEQLPPDYLFAPSRTTHDQPVATEEPAIDVRIMKLPVPPVEAAPPASQPKPQPEKIPLQPPSLQRQSEQQPAPQPIMPSHPIILPPTPPAPAVTPPKPAPPRETSVSTTTSIAPSPRPAEKPATEVAKAPPAPARTPPKAASLAPTTPIPLNIHRAAQAAPAGVATLPLAPAVGAYGRPGSPPAAAQAGAPGSSRLNGLTPYPYGFMPSGGGGLRGTLVGCANAEAVRLSGAERDKCNERFGDSIGGAPKFDPLSPAKRAAFDKAAASQEADRRYRASTTDMNYQPSDPGGIAHGPASTETLKHNAGDPIVPGDPH